jgi:propanol-preferring alcohol dehydrogenase
MADETVWPASRLVKSGELPFEQAALLPDAVATAWHALSRANVSPGGTLVVLGAGGVGTHVLQLAHAIDPSITLAAVVRSRASADRVSELNLGTVLEGIDGCARRLRSVVGLADAVIDFSGAPEAAAEGVRALRRGGVLVLGSVIDLPLEFRTTTTSVVTIDDLRTVAALALSGKLDLRASASIQLPLDEVSEAFTLIEERPPGLVRAVLVP